MGRRLGSCLVCASPDREAIDKALGAGESADVIEKRYGISRSTINRHARHIVQKNLRRHVSRESLSLRRTSSAAPVPEQLRAWLTYAMTIAEGDDQHLGLAAMREARLALSLLARLTGQLVDRTEVHVALAREREILAMSADERAELLEELRRDMGTVDVQGEEVIGVSRETRDSEKSVPSALPPYGVPTTATLDAESIVPVGKGKSFAGKP